MGASVPNDPLIDTDPLTVFFRGTATNFRFADIGLEWGKEALNTPEFPEAAGG